MSINLNQAKAQNKIVAGDMLSKRSVIKPAVEARTVTQYIFRIVEVPGQQVEALVGNGVMDLVNQVLVPEDGTLINWTFRDDEYLGLLEAKPSWAPNKPAGVYRNEDIFAYIDYVKEQRLEQQAEVVRRAQAELDAATQAAAE